MRSTVSLVSISPCGYSGSVVVAATVSLRPSGRPWRARIRSATTSLNSRASSMISSSCRCRSRKFLPTTFQCACLPCRCSSMRSTSTSCRASVSFFEAVKPFSAF